MLAFREEGSPESSVGRLERMIKGDKDEKLMRMAVGLSKRSRAEDDGRIHPMVGAVIAHPNGEIISTGYRGRYTP